MRSVTPPWIITMTTPRELRAVAEAAQKAWQSASTDPTITNAELKRLRRTANETHERWLNSFSDTMTGGRYASGQT